MHKSRGNFDPVPHITVRAFKFVVGEWLGRGTWAGQDLEHIAVVHMYDEAVIKVSV